MINPLDCLTPRSRTVILAAWITALWVSQPILAALPAATPPTTGGAGQGGTDWLQLILGYAHDGAIILGLIIAAAGLIWVSWTLFVKFNEARQGRAEWGEVGLTGVIGAVLLLFTGYLLDQSTQIMTGAGGATP